MIDGFPRKTYEFEKIFVRFENFPFGERQCKKSLKICLQEEIIIVLSANPPGISAKNILTFEVIFNIVISIFERCLLSFTRRSIIFVFFINYKFLFSPLYGVIMDHVLARRRFFPCDEKSETGISQTFYVSLVPSDIYYFMCLYFSNASKQLVQ